MDNPQKRDGERSTDGASHQPEATPEGERVHSSTQSDAQSGADTSENRGGEAPTRAPGEPSPITGAPETATTEGGGNASGGKMMFAVIIVVVAAILAGAYYFMTKNNQTASLGNGAEQTAGSKDLIEMLDLEQTDVVARVNGEALPWKDYEQSVNEVLQGAGSSGLDVKDPAVQDQIQNQALTALVNTELLLQVARSENIEASDEEVESELENIKTQIGDDKQLDTMLEKFNLTREELRESIGEQIVINQYINQTVSPDSIEVTDAEVQTMYDQVSENAQGQELPPLEEVRGAIESQLKSQKQQELVAAHIETLREGADIELLI